MKLPIDFFKNLKFRQKIRLSFLLVSVIPVAILGLFCYQQTKGLLIAQEKANLQTALQQTAVSLDNQMRIYNNLSDYLAFDADLNEAANRTYHSYLELYHIYNDKLSPLFLSMKNLHDGVERITLYSGSNMESHGDMVAPLSAVREESWYASAMDSPKINWYASAEGAVFSVRRMPEPSSGDAKQNLLYIEADPQKLFSPLAELSQTLCGVYLMDSKGKAVYAALPADVRQGVPPPVEALFQDDSPTITWKQTDYAVIRTSLSSCGWQVCLYKPIDSITDAASPIIFTVLFMIVLCLIIILLAGWALSFAMVNRIEKLRKAMREVESGNLNVTVASTSRDEVGDLIHGFQKMLNEINALINEVYEGKLSQKESELRALQAQINPHFLYNCLSLINWRAIRADAPDISEMAQLLSTFYRTTLNKGKNLTTVEDELKNTRSYIDIQRIMHSDQFEAVYQMEDNLKNDFMPNLLLQPLVENAIVHGLDQRPSKGGVVRISLRREDSRLIFTVEDNGVGIDPQLLPTLLTQDSGGYGLKNVHERVQLYYGKPYGLTLESQLHVGTRITLTLPATTNIPSETPPS